MDDIALIAKLKAHDDEALLALVEAYGRLIRQVVWHQLLTAYERGFTDDVENRVYYKVWTRIDQFDETKGSFANWLCAIAKHQAIDYERGLAATFTTLDLDNVTVVAPKTAAPDCEALFAILSPLEQQIFRLYFIQTLTVEEIAKQLHLKRDAVYQHLSRGRKKLRQGGMTHADFN